MPKNKSLNRALEIMNYFVESLLAKLGENVETIVLVGSLSNGSYIAGPGRDIDLITVLKEDTGEKIFNQVLEHIVITEDRFERDIPISKTVYWANELRRPFRKNFILNLNNKRLLEAVIELQRIHESGIIMYRDKDAIDKFPIPNREEMIFFDNLGREWSKQLRKSNPERLKTSDNLPIRIVVQSVLTRAMLHYYYSTGESCSNKHIIAEKMKQDVKGYKFQLLLDLASMYKINPEIIMPKDETAFLRQGMQELTVYIEKHDVGIVPMHQSATL